MKDSGDGSYAKVGEGDSGDWSAHIKHSISLEESANIQLEQYDLLTGIDDYLEIVLQFGCVKARDCASIRVRGVW